MVIVLWDYYGEANFRIFRITKVYHFIISYRLKRNLKTIPNFTQNSRKLLKSILKRKTQRKFKQKLNKQRYQLPTPPPSRKYKQTR